MLPQTEHTPQSCSHEAHVSGAVQRPSPQPAHLPQSSGQVKQSSLFDAWHVWSPQPLQLAAVVGAAKPVQTGPASVPGGAASTGRHRILDIQPSDIHQRVPVILGSRHEVERLAEYHAAYDRGDDTRFKSPLFNTRSLFRSA